jgi:hypothetical protein
MEGLLSNFYVFSGAFLLYGFVAAVIVFGFVTMIGGIRISCNAKTLQWCKGHTLSLTGTLGLAAFALTLGVKRLR